MQDDFNSLLDKYPRETISLAYSLHQLIMSLIPGIIATPDFSANIIGYGFSSKYADTVCTIILSKKGIKLGLYKGSSLPDPSGLLQGSGKLHKYVQVLKEEDIHQPALKALLEAGYNACLERKK